MKEERNIRDKKSDLALSRFDGLMTDNNDENEDDDANQNRNGRLNNQLVIEVDVGIEAARREDGSEVQACRLSYREEGGVVGWER